MKKKYYKKLVKKFNKLKKFIENNTQPSIVSVWPAPDLKPQEWEVTYTDTEPFIITSN